MNTNGFVTETIIYIVFPVVVIFLAGAGTFCFSLRGEDKAWETAFSSSVGVSVVIAYLMHPSLIKQFSLFFACTRMGPEVDDFFLDEDLTIRCYSSEHWKLMYTLAVPLLFVYVLGIPGMIWFILRKPTNQRHLRKIVEVEHLQVQCDESDEKSLGAAAVARVTMDEATINFESNYAFIFLGYHQNAYLWEIFVIMRKASLVVLGVGLGHDPRTQVRPGFSLRTHCLL